ncbi:hypothetical protein GM418_18100 [Maribellus comscasis]|uniref:HEAT repeat domain-containing protein n=1 Tax=Maribellus comscasis TaxID=2681766 RepID=A0A6I6JZ75_9BACT|nr:hypothetical protein [Maribellus comscasis]QGY45512.1 hypothetical protein GM418_18100 [Maribellus comscasis]
MNQEKLNKNIQAELFSTNQATVIAAIQKISVQGNKLYIPILLDLLLSNREEEIEKEITKLLGNVKAKTTVPIFIEALENKKYIPIKKAILTACWQNGLDYHDYLPVFVNIVINDNWENAFEAFTVVDNLEYLPSDEIIEKTKRIIASALKTADTQKAYFLNEILAKIA